MPVINLIGVVKLPMTVHVRYVYYASQQLKYNVKYRHYVSDVISVRTNQTVKKEEGAWCILCPPLHTLTPVRMNRLPHFLLCQDFKQVPSRVVQSSESDQVAY